MDASMRMVYWDTRSKAVYLAMKNLPPAPKGKQYQLWAIVDGKPVDAGVYALNPQEAMQKMKVIPKAEMFAITLEQEGGSATPTMEEMYVAGKV
ncbi:MAG: anti-sigma factor [Sphingobacteriales bacterium]|nr:MAG: anti-sigma factor [Sphingobacteriales bacterium]